MSKESEASDAVGNYVNKLRPGARLKYYELSLGERLTLDAMLACSQGTGLVVHAGIERLAEIAGVDEKTVKNAMNGYKRRDGSRQIGLKARGIVSVTAPHARGRRVATYRINWEAFTVDPRQTGAIEKRLQQNLPGVEMPKQPDSHEIASESPSGLQQPQCGKPVDWLPRGATVSPQGGNCSPPEGQLLPLRGATVAPIASNTALSLSPSTSQKSCVDHPDRGVVQIQKSQPWSAKPKTKASWATLYPGIRARIVRELESIMEARIGRNTADWTSEQFARDRADTLRTACRRAQIWDHVTEALVQEAYDQAKNGDN